MKEQGKLVSVSAISMDTNKLLNLPLPSVKNTGGYRITIPKNDSYSVAFAYSPIDISVCCLTKIYYGDYIPVVDLSQWFIMNDCRIGELYTYVTIHFPSDNDLRSYSISQWKLTANESLNLLLKKNAPFTFRS